MNAGNPLKLTGEAPPVRVLVCAQSNAAVDELVERLGTQGLFAVSSNGQPRRIPAMVRMGKMESATSMAQWFQIDAVAAANDEHVGEAQGEHFLMLSSHQASCAHVDLANTLKLHVNHDDDLIRSVLIRDHI